jgi:glycine oxidase
VRAWRERYPAAWAAFTRQLTQPVRRRYNNLMSPSPDVLILGGGVIGLTTAYYLAREGVTVEVVDKGDFGREASWAGAGIIPPGNPGSVSQPHEQLRAHGTAMYPQLSTELREATGIDNGYRVCGGVEWLEHEVSSVLQSWRNEGVRFEGMERGALQKVEPALAADASRAFYLPEMAQVRNPRHLHALIAWCTGRMTLRPHCPVTEFVSQEGRVNAVETGEGRLSAGNILVASGAWTGDLLASVGCRLGVRPVRGQIVLLNTDVSRVRRILLRGKRYLVPRDDGRVLVGSTEEEAGFEKRTTASAIQDLLGFAQSLVPPLATAHVENCWAGLRPSSPDGIPYLGRVPGFENLFVAAGHFRAGIQLAPITGLAMKELILGQPTTVPLESFRPDRPPHPPIQSAFRS